MRSETSRPYAFGNNCSASGPRAYVAWGFRKPGFMPEWTTSLSRSRLARCARTALSVRRNSSASSFTVLSRVRKSSRILPRVLLNNRSRQPICFIKSKIMDARRKSKKCLTNSRLMMFPVMAVCGRGKTTCQVVSAGWQPCQPSQASCLTSDPSCAKTRTVFAASCS